MDAANLIDIAGREKLTTGASAKEIVLLGEPSSFLFCMAELLRTQSSVKSCAVVHSAQPLKVLLSKQVADILLLSYGANTVGYLEVARHHKFPLSNILLLNVPLCPWSLSRMVSLGVKHVLADDCTYNEILRSLKNIHHAQFYFSASVTRHLALAKMHGACKGEIFNSLSTREWQTAQAISQGLLVTEIAERFSLSPKTVQTYRYRIYRKLNVCSDVQLTLLTQRLLPDKKPTCSAY